MLAMLIIGIVVMAVIAAVSILGAISEDDLRIAGTLGFFASAYVIVALSLAIGHI